MTSLNFGDYSTHDDVLKNWYIVDSLRKFVGGNISKYITSIFKISTFLFFAFFVYNCIHPFIWRLCCLLLLKNLCYHHRNPFVWYLKKDIFGFLNPKDIFWLLLGCQHDRLLLLLVVLLLFLLLLLWIISSKVSLKLGVG